MTAGLMNVSDARPVEPTTTSRLLRSSVFRTPDRAVTKSTRVASEMRPIQFIFETSYLTDLLPVAWAMTTGASGVAIVKPSGTATPYV